jgi:anti-sigma B factor antagonist
MGPARPASHETVSHETRDAASRRHTLRIHIDRLEGILVITPVGEIDIVTGGLFLESLIAAAEAGESRLVVDLQHVPFLDSTGLAIFLSVDRALRTVDGQLRLVAGPQIRAILGVAWVDQMFPIDASLADAVAQLVTPLPRQP